MAMKTALIVGTGPGLSASLARLFTKHGLQVAMASRDPSKLAKLAEETAGITFACEATEPDEVAGLFDAVVATIGVPDIVVYNTSARAGGPVTDLDPAPRTGSDRCGRRAGRAHPRSPFKARSPFTIRNVAQATPAPATRTPPK